MIKAILFIAMEIAVSCVIYAQDLTGKWQGTVNTQPAVHINLEISRLGNGVLEASLTIDDRSQRLPVESFSLKDSSVRFSSQVLASSYDGKVSADGKSIIGSWTQDSRRQPLTFSRVVSEETSSRPAPVSRPSPMAASVDPSFEVATIKPGSPSAGDKRFWSNGRQYRTSNTTLRDLLQVAYGVQPRQILGIPAWAEQARYDLAAQFAPDQGTPSNQQFQRMLQKLLTDRFRLKIHPSEREFPIYALVVGGRGSNLKPGNDSSEAHHTAFLRPGTGGGRLLIEKNASMADLVPFLMSQLPDRQIVDQKSLTGKFDFELNFLLEGSQPNSESKEGSESTDVGRAPFVPEALEEQLGLKLRATRAPIPVLIVDNVEKPSEN